MRDRVMIRRHFCADDDRAAGALARILKNTKAARLSICRAALEVAGEDCQHST